MEFTDLKKGFPSDIHSQRDSAAEVSAAESVVYADEEEKRATEKAMALLLHKDRTEKELSDRLYRAGFSESASRFAMAYVSRFGYINDRRYAEGYIDYHKQTKSKNEIRRKLKEKGVSDEILTEAFEACYASDRDGDGRFTEDEHRNGLTAGEYCDEDPEDTALRTLLNKRLKGRELSELTYEEKQKQMRYLAGKGFPIEKIRRMFS